MKTIRIAYGFDNEALVNWLHETHNPGESVRWIEWPEMAEFLPTHPSTHQKTVEMLLTPQKFPNLNAVFAVITHSVHIILGLLLAVTKKQITPEQLEVFWVESDGSAKRLRVDAKGEFIDRWPHGFFDERVNLLLPDEEK